MKDNAGYNGCDRGVQEWVYISNRTSFPEALATRRTEESFTTQSDNFHHLELLPFTSVCRHGYRLSHSLHACSPFTCHEKIAVFMDNGNTQNVIRRTGVFHTFLTRYWL